MIPNATHASSLARVKLCITKSNTLLQQMDRQDLFIQQILV